MADKKVVWVLGAGFSAGLGGPLLTALFTETSNVDLRIRYNRYAKLFDMPAQFVRFLYNYGRGGKPNADSASFTQGPTFELLWSNAEEFIDYLDAAAEEETGPLHARLSGAIQRYQLYPKHSLPEIRDAARRLIAAECSGFLEGVNVEGERWKPFRRWARGLGQHDTVITFNYDRVLEMLRDAQNKDATRDRFVKPSALDVVLPAPNLRPALAEVCRVFKLHGSVDWRKTGPKGAVSVSVEGPEFAFDCSAEEIAIAIPGPSKMTDSEDYKCIWDLACKALEEADAIVFVGYRFPETDAHAREALLNAIGRNNASREHHHLSVHVALGPTGPHSERLEALLRFACRTGARRHREESWPADYRSFRVEAHPLYGQDFLGVFHRDDL